MLAVEGIHTYYGRSHVLQGVSLTVDAGEVVALLGRNGAGKTTTMRSITGLTPSRRGSIVLDGEEIVRKPPHAIARAGIAYAPSGRRVFGSLTVAQNLALATSSANGSGAWTVERVHELFPKLAELGRRQAGLLSGGEQQMLKLGRALLANPKVLLLDEPTEGLAPAVVGQLREWIEQIRAAGLTVLLSEQNALFALRLADRGYILEKGRIRHAASAAELGESDEIRTYLGARSRIPRRGRAGPRMPRANGPAGIGR